MRLKSKGKFLVSLSEVGECFLQRDRGYPDPPLSGWFISRIRRTAPETASAHASKAVATTRLRGETTPQAAKIKLSQSTIVTSSGMEIEPVLRMVSNQRESFISPEI